MSQFYYVVEFTIQSGQVDAFTEQANSFIASVKDSEPGTLGYQWYLSEDGTRCLLQETFASSEAMLIHLGNVGPLLPSLMAIAPITRLEVYGSVSDDARAALDTLGAVYFPHLAGFDR